MRDIFDELPDRRIELIDGQFIVGANLEGSRRLLKVLLESWGGNAALSLTPTVAPWMKALNLAYGFSYPLEAEISAEEISAKQTIPAQTPLVPQTGNDSRMLSLASQLNMALFPNDGLETFGRDFVTKLGSNALSPTGTVMQGQTSALYEYYLDGPPDIAYEFVRDDRVRAKHYDLYWQGGINELWEFNVVTGEIRTFSFGFDKYVPEFIGRSGVITSSAIPALQIEVKENWHQGDPWDSREDRFHVISAPPDNNQPRRSLKNGVRWDSLVFAPILDLEPFPLTFDEFIAWTGETKFEGYDGRVIVCTPTCTRNVLGELLMTFGLIEAVKLMPPTFWMSAINERLQQLHQQEAIRQTMWQTARQAAQILREKFDITEIAVAGDLVNDSVLGLWSETTLVFPKLKRRRDDFEIYEALNGAGKEKVHTYYSDSYTPLEIRNTFDKMVFI
ncbi:MAG TPA: hypothetical protein VFZ34_09125 [Blastocatellia bacterium]|nr:hypothetical protein [Blastocatellia bacterium]